jgi:hypothetical protein
MEKEHTEPVVDKAVVYLKDMFGAPPYQRHVDSEGRRITLPTESLTVEGAMRFDSHAHTLKTVAQKNAERARREDESAAKSSMRKSLDDLNELSHEIRAKATNGPKQNLSPAELHADGPCA